MLFYYILFHYITLLLLLLLYIISYIHKHMYTYHIYTWDIPSCPMYIQVMGRKLEQPLTPTEIPIVSGWWFQPLWKIWKSVGMIIPNWMEKWKMFQVTAIATLLLLCHQRCYCAGARLHCHFRHDIGTLFHQRCYCAGARLHCHFRHDIGGAGIGCGGRRRAIAGGRENEFLRMMGAGKTTEKQAEIHKSWVPAPNQSKCIFS